jgi:L-aspartate oxidase
VDVVVLGSGVAGLSSAITAMELGLRVAVITKGRLDQGTTRWAQGGVAAALDRQPESLDVHLADTLAAGAGLCDAAAVRVLVDQGPLRVEDLVVLGANFDRDPDGSYQLAREGGHSVFRILHAGGSATGYEVERALVAAVRASSATILEDHFAVDLIVEDGCCSGLRVLGPDGLGVVRCEHVLIAAGGGGQLYSTTTNPSEATGDGVVEKMPRPLLTEALRGHGATLLDSGGQRFVNELLPRDVVSRAILSKLTEQGTDHVWLDCRSLDSFETRFPNIFEILAAQGLNPAVDLLPVAPAAHHQCGGILTDLQGATTLPGLWAAGETACTGVHGANRLASNSLLEGLVFGPRAVRGIATAMERGTEESATATGAMRAHLGQPPGGVGIGGRHLSSDSGRGPLTVSVDDADLARTERLKDRLQREMMAKAGVVRSAESLASARQEITSIDAEASPGGRSGIELANLRTQALALIDAAAAREESRGCHSRSDFPTTNDAQRYRILLGVDPVVPDVELESDHGGH